MDPLGPHLIPLSCFYQTYRKYPDRAKDGDKPQPSGVTRVQFQEPRNQREGNYIDRRHSDGSQRPLMHGRQTSLRHETGSLSLPDGLDQLLWTNLAFSVLGHGALWKSVAEVPPPFDTSKE